MMSRQHQTYLGTTNYRRPAQRSDFNVAIVCALPVEYDAVCLLVDDFWDDPFGRAEGDFNTYTTGRLAGHDIVILLLANTGKVGAASAVANLSTTFTSIRLILLVGICGGAPFGPRGEILLGDVIVGDETKTYDFGKQYPDGFRRNENSGYLESNFNRDVRGLLNSLGTDRGMEHFENRTSHYLARLQEAATSRAKYAYPGATEDKLFESNYRHKHHQIPSCICRDCNTDSAPICWEALYATCVETGCDISRTISRVRLASKQSLDSQVEAQRPSIHFGRVASADIVLKSANDRDRLSQELHAIGFEMEAAGFFHELPCIVIKGVCDYADSHKSKQWQPFAAATAASACKALLERRHRTDLAPEDAGRARKRERIDHAHSAVYVTSLPRNERFVGREDTLARLREILFNKRTFCRAALVGLGGVGKTQVALQLAYSLKDGYHDEEGREYSVLWIPALSMATFEQTCKDIVRRIPQLRNADGDPKQLMRDYLSMETAGRWLLVLDNADDGDLIFGSPERPGLVNFLPQSDSGCILATTRDRQVAVGLADNNVVSLAEMEMSEAEAFFQKSLIEKSQPSTNASLLSLLEFLDRIPLAIAQAAAYINSSQVTILEYLTLLRGVSQDQVSVLSRQFHDSTRYVGSQNAIALTWLASFDRIKKTDPVAADLLAFISCIEPKGIPLSLLPEGESRGQFLHAVGTLRGYAFLIRRQEETYDMHSLVHAAIGVWKRLESEDAINLAIKQVASVFPRYDYMSREKWREYLPHAIKILRDNINSENGDSQSLGLWVGWCLQRDGRIREAVPLLEHIVAVWEKTLGEEHPSRLASQHELAGAYQADGQIKRAILLLEHVVAVREKTLGEEHPDRLASQHVLAGAYQADGQIKRAILLLEHVVAVREKTLGEEHPDRLASQSELAGVYQADGQIKRAILLLEHVVAVEEKTLGEEHPDRLVSQHELARVYKADGQIKRAILLLEYVVAVQEKALGEEHPHRLASQHVLAGAYQADGQIKRAILLLEHVVAVQEKKLGEEHPDRLASQSELAGVYQADGQIKRAILLLEHVVAVQEKKLGEEHPDRLVSQSELAGVYQADGQIKRAILLLEYVVAVWEKTLGEEHPDRLTSQHELARVYEADGQIKRAILLLEHVVAVQEKTLGEEHPDRLASQHVLAGAYQADGQIKRAILLLEHVVAVREKTLGEEHPDRLTSQHVLAGAYQADGQIKRAILLLEHVVAVREKTLGEEHLDRLVSQHELARVYEADGQIKRAILLLEHVVAVEEKTLGEEHPDRLTSQYALAGVYRADGQIKMAISLLEHVVAVEEKTLGEEHPDRLTSQHALAGVYRADGKIKMAISLLEHVVAVEEKTLSEEHPDRLISLQALIRAYSADGNGQKADALIERFPGLSLES